MGKNKAKTAEETIRGIALRANVPEKTIYSLVTHAIIDDTHFSEKMVALSNVKLQQRQVELMHIQTANELILNRLLSFRLKRKLKFLRFFHLIKKQDHGHNKGIPELKKV